jgi:hypothetical protein
MAMAFLTRDQILGAKDLTAVEVAAPEWGGTVRVRMLTGTERDAFEAETVTRQGKRMQVNMVNLRARLVARTVVDEEGARLFSDADVVELAKKSSAALNRVFEAAQRLNGLTEKAEDEAAENFPNGQSGGSTSD